MDENGCVLSLGKTFGGERALNKIMKLVIKEARGKQNLRFAIAHANAFEKANWLRDNIARMFEVKDIMIVNVSPALGAHAGPGAAGVAFLGD